MSALRPSSVCDTTPLQRLESQSSSSEPSSPSPTLNGICIGDNRALDVGDGDTTTTTVSKNDTTLSLANHNNNKIEIRLNNRKFVGTPMKMDLYDTRKVCCRIIFDMLILTCLGFPIISFHLWGSAYKRGFFCDDASLKHPYRDSTVHNWMLYLIGFAVPMSIIITTEFFNSNSNRLHGIGNLSADRYYFCQMEIPDWIVECYKRIGLLVFGAVIGQLTTDIAKYSIGRFRPHFFAVCQPILYDGTTCDDPMNVGLYIEEFECLGLEMSAKRLKEVRLSFPSGHACFSFLTMIYITVYLQRRLNWQRCKMIKHFMQFLFLMFAWYTALTRISDYKHHVTDVLAGSTIGIFYSVMIVNYMW